MLLNRRQNRAVGEFVEQSRFCCGEGRSRHEREQLRRLTPAFAVDEVDDLPGTPRQCLAEGGTVPVRVETVTEQVIVEVAHSAIIPSQIVFLAQGTADGWWV